MLFACSSGLLNAEERSLNSDSDLSIAITNLIAMTVITRAKLHGYHVA